MMSSPPNPTICSLLLPTLMTLLACGGAPELSVSGPEIVSVTFGDTTTVELALQRNDAANDDVTLSVDGLPDGVTATFEPATVSGASVTASLRLEAARNASNALTLVTVRATGPKELIAEHTFALDVRGLTVTGRVRAADGDFAQTPVTIRIGDAWTATDPSGHFTIPDVAVPYDLHLIVRGFVEVYTELRTPTPEVHGFFFAEPLHWDAVRIDGVVSPLPAAGQRVRICASSPAMPYPSCTGFTSDGTRDHFTLWADTWSTDTHAFDIVARQKDSSDASPFRKFGQVSLTATPGDTVNITVPLSEDSSTAIPFELGWDGSAVSSAEVFIPYGEKWVRDGEVQLQDGRNGVVHLPDGALSAVIFGLERSEEAERYVARAVDGPFEGPLELAPSPRLLSPAEGATPSIGTELSIEQGSEGLRSFVLITSDWRYLVIHTFDDRIEVPDLTAPTPIYDGNTTFGPFQQWAVISTPTVTTKEAALQNPVGLRAMDEPSTLVGPDFSFFQMSTSTLRTFASTAPTLGPVTLSEHLEATRAERRQQRAATR